MPDERTYLINKTPHSPPPFSMPDERTYLISKTEDLGSNGGHSLGDDVLELRSWLDDPYEQVVT